MKTKIAEYRKKAHLTQKQAAEALGIGERLFQSYEYGTVLPSVATGIRIAKLLKRPSKNCIRTKNDLSVPYKRGKRAPASFSYPLRHFVTPPLTIRGGKVGGVTFPLPKGEAFFT